jgi:hypothetical protein
MLRRVALVKTDVSEELSASFIRVFLRCVRRLIVIASVVLTSQILIILIMEELSSSETSVLIRATWRNIPENTILHSHLRQNLKSYKIIYVCCEGHRIVNHNPIIRLMYADSSN